MKDCITRNERTIKSEYELNGKKIEIEQRLLTDAEVDQYKKEHVDITNDPDVFKALLANERSEKRQADALKNPSKEVLADELSDDVLHKILSATKAINDAKKEIDYWFITKSISENIFYGGFMKIDGKNIEEDKVIGFIRLLEQDIITELLTNANKLSFPTEVEVTEAK